MKLPTNWHPEEEPLPVCGACQKPVSREFVEWAQEGNRVQCDICGTTKKPDDITEDPDYQLFQVDFQRAMASCYCRCTCLPDMHSPSPDCGATFTEDSEMSDTTPETDDIEQSLLPDPIQVGQTSSLSDRLRVGLSIGTSPSPPIELDTFPARPGVSAEVAESRRQMRERYDLPDLRFSDTSNETQARLEEMEMALEDAETAQAFEDFEGAYHYTQAAVSFGREVYDSEHQIILETRDYMMEMLTRWGEDEGDDTSPED